VIVVIEHLIIDWNMKGLRPLVSPANSELEYLEVYSLSLGEGESMEITFKEKESAVFILKGSLETALERKNYVLGVHDVVFLGPDAKASFRARTSVRAIVACAPSPIETFSEVIRIDEVLRDPGLRKSVGKDTYFREVITVIGDNIKAARLIAGYTWVKAGNWSSWPPHEHGDLMEEVYIFYELPSPGFGIQFVYETLDKAKVFIVRENSLVVIPRGYHPNVVAPGFEMKYLWIISARRAFEDRRYGAWRVDPAFQVMS